MPPPPAARRSSSTGTGEVGSPVRTSRWRTGWNVHIRIGAYGWSIATVVGTPTVLRMVVSTRTSTRLWSIGTRSAGTTVLLGREDRERLVSRAVAEEQATGRQRGSRHELGGYQQVLRGVDRVHKQPAVPQTVPSQRRRHTGMERRPEHQELLR